VATKQQDNRTATPIEELTAHPKKAERPRREPSLVGSWFSFGDWRIRSSSSSEDWALA